MVIILGPRRPPRIRLTNAAGARQWFDNHPVEALVSHTQAPLDDTPRAISVRITTDGDAQAQARLRHVRFGIFDPQAAFKTEFRQRIMGELLQFGVNHFPLFGHGRQLRITVTFCVLRMRKGIDNMLKLIMDVLEGPVYGNDANVTFIVASKIQAIDPDEASTDITVDEVWL